MDADSAAGGGTRPENEEPPRPDARSDAAYRLAEPAGWAIGVAAFSQRAPEDYGDIVILSGRCPRCTHLMEVELPIEKRTGLKLTSTKEDYETLDRPFSKTASCNCRHDHKGRPTSAMQGCGAFGRLEVGNETAPERGIVRVEGKEFKATLADVEWERKAERLEAEELATVRATGEKWTATVSSITGIFSVVALIKGPEDIAEVNGFWEATVIAFVVLALALAVAAIVTGAIAAYGLPRYLRPLGGPLRREHTREARKARRFIAGSVGLAVGAVSALTIAIAVTWAATPEKSDKKQESTEAALLTKKTLAAFRGPVEVRRSVPAGQPGDALCIYRYVRRAFRPPQPEGKWWTSCSEGDRFGSVAEMRERLALPPRFQPRLRNLRVRAEIPEGTRVTYVVGKVAPQCERAEDRAPKCQGRRYSGGSDQFYFPKTSSLGDWITQLRCTEQRESEPSMWFRCTG